MSDKEGVVTLLKARMGPDMEYRYTDKAFFYAVRDAIEGKVDLRLVGKNVFRPEVSRPVIDDFIMDEEVVLAILGRMNYPEPI